MNRLFIGIWILACLFAGCSDDKEDNGGGDEGGTSELAVSPEELVFGSEGGEKTFTIRTEEYWQVGYPVFWFETSPREGTGDATISAIARANEEYDDRNFNLTIQTLSGQTKVMTVTQKKKDAILLTKDKYDMESEGGNFDVEVKSNVTYTVSIQEDCQEWIKQVDLGRGLETRMVHFEVAANPDAEKREGMVVFKDEASELADTVHVYQARLYELILSESEVYVPTEGKQVSVELRSNVDYEVIIPREASEWIALLEGRSSRVDRLVFNVLENTTHDNRSADIVVRDKHGELADTLVIHQVQKDALVISRDTYEVSAEGEDITVEVKSNVDYEAIVLAGAGEWIQRVEKGRALVTTELHYKVLANPTYAAREGRIVIKDKKSELADTIKIVQAARNDYVILKTEQDLIDLRESGLTVVMGDLTVEGNELKTLQQLNNLITEVKGNVVVKARNLTSLDGLYGLKKVGGNLELTEHSLSKLEGLNNLAEVGGNFNIVNIGSFQELVNLEMIGGDFKLSGKCKGLKSFQGLGKLRGIGGDFEVSGSCSELKSFQGLNKLRNIGGDFEITAFLTSLSSFEGLDGLESIGGSFRINAPSGYYFVSLSSFSGLGELKNIGGDFEVIASNCLNALSSFKGLDGLESIGGSFRINASASDGGYSLASLSSFNGLGKLKSIGSDFEIIASTSSFFHVPYSLRSLSSFEGLDGLERIGGSFRVKVFSDGGISLESLSSFRGLGRLKSIGGDFEVKGRMYALNSFGGLSGLGSVGGSFNLSSLNELTSLNGLEKLTSITGKLTIDRCGELNNISGLANLRTVADISVTNCGKLYSFCALKAAVENTDCPFYTAGNGYNPTKYQLLNGECSREPETRQ